VSSAKYKLSYSNFYWYVTSLPIPVEVGSNERVCCRSLAGIASANRTGVWMDVCLLRVSCVVRQRSLRRADHSSRGILPSVVCLSVFVNSIIRRPWPLEGLAHEKIILFASWLLIFSPNSPTLSITDHYMP